MASQEMQWLLKEKYHGEKSEAFFADCRKLALGEPLAYLIGHAPFLGTTIHLDSRPLIPRPETEAWVAEAISVIKTQSANRIGIEGKNTVAVLDLCAGSGCIGVAVAAALDTVRITFSEIDERHIPTISKNCHSNSIAAERRVIHHTSLFDGITGTFDYILSNPPYIDAALNRVDPSVQEFEPHLALFGGAGGLDVICEIITTSPAHLAPGGQLWIEHEPEQVPAITDVAISLGYSITTHRDQYHTYRYSVLVL